MANYRDRPLSANGERVLADRVAQENGRPVERDPNGGAPMNKIKGFYEEPYSSLDYSKLRQKGVRHKEAVAEAQRLKREKIILGPGGKQMSDDNPSARAKAFRDQVNNKAAGQGLPVGAGQNPAPNGLSGEGNDVPLSDTTGGYANTPDQQDPFKNVKPAGAPAAPPDVQPVDSSTMRQPMGRVGMSDARGALDAAGNPASDSNPAAGTPAELRQMARDAAMGRTVNTVGTTGLTPSATGGRPTQAPDFRRMITSKYGTGTNVAREPGQGPATTKDLMGRTVPLGQYLADQKAVQATKYDPDAAQAGEDYFKPSAPANMRAKARRVA